MPYTAYGDSTLYLQRNLKEILPRALNEVCQIRPRDPIEYLARYLYKAADCDLYFEEKAIFETQKRMLEIQLKQEEQQRQNAVLRYKKQITQLQRCLHREGRKKTVGQLAQGPLTSRPRSQPSRPVSAGAKKDKHHERRLFLFGISGPSDESSPADVSDVDISRRASSKTEAGSSRKSSLKRSIVRKVSSPLSEIRSVVSEQRDSLSSSRTQDDDLLERSPSTLTSSSRTTGKRLSVSFGEEETREWLTPPLQSTDADVKQKLKSEEGERKKEKAISETRGRKKKTKDIDSSSDVSSRSDDIHSVSELIGVLERVDKFRDQIHKSGHRRRKIKVSTADDETARDMTADSVTADSVTADSVAADDMAADAVSAVASSLPLVEVVQKEEAGEEDEEEIKRLSTLTEAVEEGEIKISVAMKPHKLAMKIRDEIPEKESLKILQEKQLETQTLPGPVKVVKKKHKDIAESLKAAVTDQATQTPPDERVESFEPSVSIKWTRSRSREASFEASEESGEDETESGESEDDLYEKYDTDNQPSPTGEVIGDDKVEQASRRDAEREHKRKRSSILVEDIEERQPKSETASISVRDTDQKRKGKRRTGKREGKSVEDDEAEQRQKGPSMMDEAFGSATLEPELQKAAGKKRKKPKSKARRSTSFATEDGEEVSKDEQEDEKPGLTSSSFIVGKKGRKGKSKQRKFTSVAAEDGEEVSEEDTRRASISRRYSLSRETSETQISRKSSVTKATRKFGIPGAHSRRRSFRSSITESSMISDQLSHLLIPEYAEAVGTSLGSSEIEQMAESKETPYVCPFTAVECEWFLADTHTLVCRHPVLGDIRSRPQGFNFHTLDIVGWTEPRNYTWQAVYDHEMYTVKDPYQDNDKFRRRFRSLLL